MKLWGRVSSINVQKALWGLVEVGARFERIDAGGAFGIVDTPEYRRLNPNGLVPTLEDGDFVLWESNAILRYLGDRFAEAGLYPAAPNRRAEIDQWLDWQSTNATPAMRDAFWQLIRTPADGRDREALARSLAASERAAAVLDGHLARRDYVCGDAFTIADVAVGAHVHRWLHLPLEREPRPHVEAWYGRVAARPAAQQIVAIPLT